MKRTLTPQLYHFTIVIEAAEEGGYYAFCPALPGCYTQGETLEETKANAHEAIQCHLESLLHDGQPIPQPHEEFVSSVHVSLPVPHGR